MEVALRLEYNDSQMRALMGGLNGQQIVLIQVHANFAFCIMGIKDPLMDRRFSCLQVISTLQ